MATCEKRSPPKSPLKQIACPQNLDPVGVTPNAAAYKPALTLLFSCQVDLRLLRQTCSEPDTELRGPECQPLAPI